jgi:hypothetical protein
VSSGRARLPDYAWSSLPASPLVGQPNTGKCNQLSSSRSTISESKLMKLGISILIGPLKLWLGTPRCRLSIGRLGRHSRKTRAKSVETSRKDSKELSTKSATAGDTAPTSKPKPTTFQLDPVVRQDSIDALVALKFKRKEAVARVDAVTRGSTAEEIIKSALRGGHCVSQ